MQTRFFRLAEQVAHKSTHRVKIGAVLVRKGQVLNVGYNQVGKTHPKYDWFLHAELDVCLGMHRHDLSGATVYLFRRNRLGVVLNCQPCGTCQTVLKELGIRTVYFTSGNRAIEIPTTRIGNLSSPPIILNEPHYAGMRFVQK